LNELLEENKSLKEHLSQLQQQQQSQVTNDPSSLSSFNSPVDETPQLQNGVIEKIIVRKIFYLEFNFYYLKLLGSFQSSNA
jgi:hypothetical protein